MNIESHDYTIITVIAGIILLQVVIFLNNLKKIRTYKNTIQKIQNFEIVEVSVPEDWIREVEVDEILKDPGSFQKLSSNYNPEATIKEPENVPSSSSNGEDNLEVASDALLDEEDPFLQFEDEEILELTEEELNFEEDELTSKVKN